MPQFIHRNGDNYRMWSTIVDAYVTKRMTRAELARHLMQEAVRDAEREIAERIERADTKGTSEIHSPPRDVTAWDQEMCELCGCMHHAADIGSDTSLRCCDDPPDHPRHGPPCKAPDHAAG